MLALGWGLGKLISPHTKPQAVLWSWSRHKPTTSLRWGQARASQLELHKLLPKTEGGWLGPGVGRAADSVWVSGTVLVRMFQRLRERTGARFGSCCCHG
jgi:hypothetical protein